ncbi:hypothetical protein NP233_g851 [Leucocoprinus birnbaumii]|uniref:Uncharacterized protein n=1 Tax=Leucocoprinus birnbaumii TaxID=56174 RepID=A0AAD5YVE5_9AGAR|nr:hypothetical protein NP233_g851 [Leucocoprinus birnbaumii]
MGASAKIAFYGTSITVYGTVSANNVDDGTKSAYSIDGGIGSTYTTSPTKSTQYQVKFFQSPTLSPGRHTLEITNESPGGWFWLDYVLVANSTAPSSSSVSSSSAATSTSTASVSLTSSTPTFTPPSTVTVAYTPSFTPSTDADEAAADTNVHHHKGPNAGPIVGAVFGTMFGLVLLGVLIWFVRRKMEDRYANEAAAIPDEAAILPPTSKAAQGLSKSPGSRPNSGYDIPISPSTMVQVHHQHQASYHQQSQHSRYGSNVSASGVYPFSPAGGNAQQAYHSNPTSAGQRAPPFMGNPQQGYHQPQPHGRQNSLGLPPRVPRPLSSHNYSNSTGGVSLGYNPYQHGQANLGVHGPQGPLSASASEYNQGVSGSRPSSPLVYPGVPPVYNSSLDYLPVLDYHFLDILSRLLAAHRLAPSIPELYTYRALNA